MDATQKQFSLNRAALRGKFLSEEFTFFELLVVIAIIAILVGMLVPTLGRAKESGRRTHCISNLRQIGLGIQMYRDENSDRPWCFVRDIGICSAAGSAASRISAKPLTSATLPCGTTEA